MTRYVAERRDMFGVELILSALGVSSSTYHGWRSRPESERARRDRELIELIEYARRGYRSVYGIRKTWHELLRTGVDVGRDRVQRLMRSQGWHGVQRGKRVRTTIPVAGVADSLPDLLARDFTALAPNEKWVADFTYVRTYSGFCYLAFVLDVFSRRIVGWQIATHMRTELVMDALDMAAALRQPGDGLIAHSDRGSQYTSIAYTDRLEEIGAAPSVGSRGDAYDNAMAESWVGTFKAELIQGRTMTSFEHAEHEATQWIGFYNNDRLHEMLDFTPPAEYESRHDQIRAALNEATLSAN